MAIFEVASEKGFNQNYHLAWQRWASPSQKILYRNWLRRFGWCFGLLRWSGLLGWSSLLGLSFLWSEFASPKVSRLWASTICASYCGVPCPLAEMEDVLFTAFPGSCEVGVISDISVNVEWKFWPLAFRDPTLVSICLSLIRLKVFLIWNKLTN